MGFQVPLHIKLGLLKHVVSDKYVDVDFENVDVELSIFCHEKSREQKCLKKSIFINNFWGYFRFILFTAVLIYMHI